MPALVRRAAFSIALALSTCFGPAACAAEASAAAAIAKKPAKPQLLLLATYHMANPGLDVVKQQADDILSPRRQQELEALVADLATFKPTVVAVEELPRNEAKLKQRYADWRAGKAPLGRGEIEQIGFRLLQGMGGPDEWQMRAINWNGMPPGELKAYNYEEWAEARGQTARLQAIRARSQAESDERYLVLHAQGLRAFLQLINSAEYMAASHARYFEYATLGDDEWGAGANWVGHWMTRNLRMFGKLRELAQPGARVLLIVGSGHAKLLSEYARESGVFEVVDTQAWLKAKP